MQKGPLTGEDWPRVRSFTRRVFISHASEDAEIAFNVASMLKRHLDLDPFVDEGSLRFGADWTARMLSVIQGAELLILLESRMVAGDLADGVRTEVELARALNIPIVIGTIRGYRHEGVEPHVDFGHDGRRVDGVWGIARYLLSESHQFRALGLDSIQLNSAAAASVLGTPESMATRAEEILVLGHTMKLWLGDYANPIRHATAKISMYFPAREAIGLELLSTSHRIGRRVLDQIARTKQDALAVQEEIGDPDRFQCFVVPVKPMLSATVVNPDQNDSFIVVDHYLHMVGAEGRPKLILQGARTPLYELYWRCFQSIIETARPLAEES